MAARYRQRVFAGGAGGPPRTLIVPLLGIMAVFAWAALWWLEQSVFSSLFYQHDTGHAAHHGHAMAPPWLAATGFVAGWLLMTVAMMLPTTFPLVGRFQHMVSARRRGPLVVLLVLGYLGAWLPVGLLALLLVKATGIAGTQLPVLRDAPWIWSAGLFFFAGGFQFSKLKYACLEKCRTPLGFLASHWHGRRELLESFNIGWRHGLYCVGCCWALMLLMFAVGTASLAWMLVLAVVMAAEKNLAWGKRLVRPLGSVLICTGTGIVFSNLIL